MKFVSSQKKALRVLIGCMVGLLSAVGFVMAAAFAGAGTDQVVQAVRAPYIAFFHRDPGALCADFTPTAANHLVRNNRGHDACALKVAAAFKTAAPYEQRRSPFTLEAVSVTGIATNGDQARATVHFGKRNNVSYQFAFQKVHQRWLIAPPAVLTLLKGCYIHAHFTQDCSMGAHVVLLTIGVPRLQIKEALSITPPPAVSHAGGRELQEFEIGSKIMVDSGCLACHKIYERGNQGPGPDLTHIGSKLSEEQIEHAVVDATAPMPSFKHLPQAKLKALVKFLSLLK
jgi:Cytochrome C oxidase, cbb3-type, subunit III